VKDQLGIGKPMYLQFYAPLDERSDKQAAKEIIYDHKSLPDDLQLLEKE